MDCNYNPTGALANFAINREMLSQERWQAILHCKQNFLRNDNEDLSRYPYMDQEVAASWIRSRRHGVNPYSVVTSPNLSREKFSEILEKNRYLIDITNSLVKSFRELILSCGYLFYLFEKNGIVLINEGNWDNLPLIPEYNTRTGIVADESSEGTTAHELCFRLKRPVQLLGPEHYCIAFQNSIASAAPIKDESGEILAALVLVSQPLLNSPGEETLKSLGPHCLGLATSMALTIESQVRSKKMINSLIDANEKAEVYQRRLQFTKEKLVVIRDTLDAALGFIDEGVISTDRAGNIIHINQAGRRILKMSPKEDARRNIIEFLGSSSSLMSLIEKGENMVAEERLCIGSEKNAYQVQVRPVINQFTQELDVVVLKLSAAEKVSAQLSNKSGGIANFTFEDIVSDNKEFKKSLGLARRFATAPENILVIGESGTGKELYAQAIHNVHRPQGPFIAVNCAAMPRELIECELFGYEGGSFTGAERSGRPGKVELAHGGTLFLDEIGDMPLELQAVLLRTLEDKQVMRIGGSRYKKVDFRLVAATNKDLYKMVKENLFREDLYFRLSVLNIRIPPLRERGNDVKLLSEYFVDTYCQKQGWKVPQIHPAALKKITEYQWPGNVRQLQNAMIYAVNTVQGDWIKPENLPEYIIMETCPIKVDEITGGSGNLGEMLCLETLEKAAIEAALSHANFYVPAAAEILGISRSTLYRKLKDYNIEY